VTAEREGASRRETEAEGRDVGVDVRAQGRRGVEMTGILMDTYTTIRSGLMGLSSGSPEPAAGSAKDVGASAVAPAAAGEPQRGLSGKKICCACPDTRKARDACTVTAVGDPESVCRQVIEAHNACLRADGFQV